MMTMMTRSTKITMITMIRNNTIMKIMTIIKMMTTIIIQRHAEGIFETKYRVCGAENMLFVRLSKSVGFKSVSFNIL